MGVDPGTWPPPIVEWNPEAFVHVNGHVPTEAEAQAAVRTLLAWIGEDVHRPGLVDTPGRVARALREMTAGYAEDPAEHLDRQFPDSCDEMVCITGVPWTSLCEHHLLPVVGTATIAYLPNPATGHVVGLSKLARVLDGYSRRLQVQERLTQQVADAIEVRLGAGGVGVVLRAEHGCMSCRGVRKAGTVMVTSALRGAMKEQAATRAEFLALAHTTAG